jgi:hypothetical protein
MKLLSDNPASDDGLGFTPSVDLLTDVIETAEPPFTIGVFGEWGCGKTTLMRMVAQKLQTKHRKTVWFNAWKYDGKEVIWNALIQAIFYAMRSDPEVKTQDGRQDFRNRVAHTALALAKYAAKVGTRLIPGDIIRAEDVDTVVDAFRAPDATSEEYEFINSFEANFDRLVREYVGDDATLTIFIDDLDRCLPENAIMVFESIKLYLDRASCVFVIGAESAIIEEGIRLRYGEQARLSARDYIEKIVQLPFMMRGIEPQSAFDLLSVDPDTKKLFARPEMQTLIVAGTDCNPRRLKRFLNGLLLLEKLAGAGNPRERAILSKVLILQMRFPTLFYAMLKDPDIAARLTDIARMNGLQQQGALVSAGQLLNALHADEALMQFLRRTADIPCGADDVEPCIRLAAGVASSAPKASSAST